MKDYGWLFTGALVALMFGAFGPEIAAALQQRVPLPWARIVGAVLVFAAFAALHFRLQLMRSLESEGNHLERSAAASRLIQSASDDGRRWLRVVQENLELVDEGNQTESHRALYLGGARAHADKLDQAFDRIDGNREQLDRSRS